MTDFWTRLTNGPCYIIAEIGVNHNGDYDKALKLIDESAKAGANAVKFQTFRADELTLPGPHRDMLSLLQVPFDWYPGLMARAKMNGVDFLSSPFDIESAKFLKELGVPALKIPSGELTNLQYLSDVAKLDLPLIISTGMATREEVWDAAEMLQKRSFVAWLHCVSSYPAPIAGYNLRCMGSMRNPFMCDPVGISDHTMGDTLAIAAVAMGAKIIEKHITLCYEDEGPDHAASMEPGEFALMVHKIRQVESAMGDGIKRPTAEELLTMPRARRVQTAEGFKRSP